MANERWSLVEDCANYSVSANGLIKNNRSGRILKPSPDSHGYPQVILSDHGHKKAHLVHRLVAKAFVDGYDDALQVNHRDGNKFNNRSSNLEWVTPSENSKHAYRTGLAHKCEYSGALPVSVRVMETGRVYASESECARNLGIKREGINACVNGRLDSYYGLHFERVT